MVRPTKTTTLEKTIVANGMAELRRRGYWAVKNHGNEFSVKGLPDVFAIKEGRIIAIEFKRPGEDPTKIQMLIMSQLESFGCRCCVCRSVDDVKEFLEAL